MRHFYMGLGFTLCLWAVGYTSLNNAYAELMQVESEQEAAAQLFHALQAVVSLQGDFSQDVYDADTLLDTFYGTFAIKAPDALYWQTEEPEEQLLIADGEMVWYYNPFIEQVTLFSQQQIMNENPLFILLNQEGWDKFLIQKIDTQEESSRYHIRHKHKYADMDLFLTLSQDGDLSQLEWVDAYGQRSVFQLKNIQKNQKLAQDKFTFVVPAGVDIDDQRDL